MISHIRMVGCRVPGLIHSHFVQNFPVPFLIPCPNDKRSNKSKYKTGDNDQNDLIVILGYGYNADTAHEHQ